MFLQLLYLKVSLCEKMFMFFKKLCVVIV
jgi:hypothetical protein